MRKSGTVLNVLAIILCTWAAAVAETRALMAFEAFLVGVNAICILHTVSQIKD
jgi:hypothetical protein